MRSFNKVFRIPDKLRSIWYRKYNILKFYLCGISFGDQLCVNNKIHIVINKGAQITLGSHFHFSSGDNTNPLSRIQRGCMVAERKDAKIVIGNCVRISSSCLWAKDNIKIGNYVNIGADCILMDSDAHSLDWGLRMIGGIEDISNAKCAPIIIEDHVFIGARSIILKGVHIGARSIIAAGSVVSRDIPSDCMAGGNPCRVIKYIC